MKKWLKNSKGFTLVELLAVIVILGVIAAIAVPVVSATIQNSRERSDVASLALIRDAVTRWAIETEVVDDVAATELSVVSGAGYLQGVPAIQSRTDLDFDQFSISVDGFGMYDVNILDTDGVTEIVEGNF
ncbi:type II secretion system protein [Cohnella kolymensis]|uniref:type II secretion system protein n=1 Tax=Cohnella kolymensis TaxID=1590652 RepID=UPI0006989C2E|nr:prepilin-type N-terminal cleavage/methylation domain-containing protein [Cohnella kolymensis]